MQRNAGNTFEKDALSENLERISSDKGFMISDNEGSGNCMFHALSEQLHLVKGTKISHTKLKRYAVPQKEPKTGKFCCCGSTNVNMWFN